MPQHALPIIHAILICDKVISEAINNKKSLIGVFDSIYYTQLPVAVPELWVYVNLSDVLEKHVIRIELVCLDDNRKIVEIKSELPSKGKPNRELSYCFRNMIFEKDGVYAFRFWVEDDVIGEKYLRVTRRS